MFANVILNTGADHITPAQTLQSTIANSLERQDRACRGLFCHSEPPLPLIRRGKEPVSTLVIDLLTLKAFCSLTTRAKTVSALKPAYMYMCLLKHACMRRCVYEYLLLG